MLKKHFVAKVVFSESRIQFTVTSMKELIQPSP